MCSEKESKCQYIGVDKDIDEKCVKLNNIQWERIARGGEIEKNKIKLQSKRCGL